MIDSTTLNFVQTCDQYVITFHQNPDGDAIGSALGLHQFLKKQGKQGMVISPNEVGDYLKWLPGVDEVEVYEREPQHFDRAVREAKAVFCLDFNDPNRCGGLENIIQATTADLMMIDHHLFPKDFTKYKLHSTESPATALLILELIQAIDDSLIDENIAMNLYTGLMTDTGSFRFPATNAKTHLGVARLMETGFQHERAHENIFDTFTEKRLKLYGNSFSNRHELLSEFKTSYIYVTKEDHVNFDIKKGDTEGLVNYNLSLEGVMFGVLFIENDEMVKISFRSKGTFPANEFARKYFQGGGHLNAAGGRSFISLDRTIKRFKKHLGEFIEQNPI